MGVPVSEGENRSVFESSRITLPESGSLLSPGLKEMLKLVVELWGRQATEAIANKTRRNLLGPFLIVAKNTTTEAENTGKSGLENGDGE